MWNNQAISGKCHRCVDSQTFFRCKQRELAKTGFATKRNVEIPERKASNSRQPGNVLMLLILLDLK
jgi:hypothetical protein